MRRLLAIAIVFFLGLPAVSPLFALTGAVDPSLPACCRRDGRHHCMAASAMSSPSSSSPTQAITALMTGRCPYGSHSLPGNAHRDLALDTSAAIFAGVLSHPSGSPQTESMCRIAADRSRQKRGPPASIPA